MIVYFFSLNLISNFKHSCLTAESSLQDVIESHTHKFIYEQFVTPFYIVKTFFILALLMFTTSVNIPKDYRYISLWIEFNSLNLHSNCLFFSLVNGNATPPPPPPLITPSDEI